MTLTLLVDLDDTLLENKMDTFIPAYLEYIAEFLAAKHPPDKLIKNLLFSTQQMINNELPSKTLKRAFDEHFYPALGTQESALREDLEKFYRESFPRLKPLTARVPGATEFIQESKHRGYHLVLATNPLFPRTAITQRLNWAGLHPADFQLITSYETFHFSKPNPAYYAEILGRIGWKENSTIMLGDSVINDIEPATSLGLPTYWITHESTLQNNPRQGSGPLKNFFDWLDAHTEDTLSPDFRSPETSLAILRSTPAVINYFLGSIPEDCWTYKLKDSEWALVEIICHLRDVDKEINLPRIQTILAEDNPFLPAIDSDAWAKERNYINQNGLKALQDFNQVRLSILDILAQLNQSVWSKPTRHTLFGPTQFSEIIRFIAGHDRLHIRQLTQHYQGFGADVQLWDISQKSLN